MTNTNWRELNKINDILKKWGVEPHNSASYEITQLIDSCLKDQKAELLEKMPEKKEWGEDISYSPNEIEAFNKCLEIIKGLIKGDD